MKWGIYKSFILLLLSLSLFPGVILAGDTLTVEVDVIADETFSSELSIEVPDKVDMGEINEGDATEKFQIYINNTGNVDVTITPELVSPYNSIFDNLYFQNRKTGNNSQEFQIGDYSFSIAKPSSSGKRSEYFWMWLDLADYSGDIEDDLISEKADVRFIALPKV